MIKKVFSVSVLCLLMAQSAEAKSALTFGTLPDTGDIPLTLNFSLNEGSSSDCSMPPVLKTVIHRNHSEAADQESTFTLPKNSPYVEMKIVSSTFYKEKGIHSFEDQAIRVNKDGQHVIMKLEGTRDLVENTEKGVWQDDQGCSGSFTTSL